jgi:hypothetical protein
MTVCASIARRVVSLASLNHDTSIDPFFFVR